MVKVQGYRQFTGLVFVVLLWLRYRATCNLRWGKETVNGKQDLSEVLFVVKVQPIREMAVKSWMKNLIAARCFIFN